MVTCCFCYEPWWAYLLRMLLEGATELMIYATPAAICAVVWDVFANHGESRKDITVLGLDASTPIYLPTTQRTASGWRLLLYLLTGFSTFGFGVLVFDLVQALS